MIYIYIYYIHLFLLEYGDVDALLPESGGVPCCHDEIYNIMLFKP